MTLMNKRGQEIELKDLIIGIAVIIVVVVFVLILVAGYLTPTLGSLACGANTRIKGASPITELVPLLMCKQFYKPVQIDGTKFTECPGLNLAICENSRGILQDACQRQCVRIQLDNLADVCWSMAGNGKYDFIGAVGKDFGTDKAILRCFRWQVVEPTKNSKRQDWRPLDDSNGNSSEYYALAGPLNNAELAAMCNEFATEENPTCALGGGVKAVAEAQIPFPDKLNYYAPEARQICYMSYVQSGQWRYVERSCLNWAPSLGGSKVFYLN